MSLFINNPKTNLLPYDGIVNDLDIVIDNPNELYEKLLSKLNWQSDIVKVFGKTYVTSRQVVFMGDKNINYKYSNQNKVSLPWITEVFHVKQMIESKLAENNIYVNFNVCLLNYYPNGESGMGYHADNEPELGDMPIIASLSLGAKRKFVLKHNTTKHNCELWLDSGHLIVMRGATQSYWKHTITKSKLIKEGRINLTFRSILNSTHH